METVEYTSECEVKCESEYEVLCNTVKLLEHPQFLTEEQITNLTARFSSYEEYLRLREKLYEMENDI